LEKYIKRKRFWRKKKPRAQTSTYHFGFDSSVCEEEEQVKEGLWSRWTRNKKGETMMKKEKKIQCENTAENKYQHEGRG
jgi:hypothetical protein